MAEPRKILWLVSTTLPAAAAACGLAGGSDVSGGWLTGQLAALNGSAALVVCSVDARTDKVRMATSQNVKYIVLPAAGAEAFTVVLRAEAPALVHIWGTEYPAARTMQLAAGALGLPVLIDIQGVMRDCARHLCEGVPAEYLGSCALQRWIDSKVPGGLLDKKQAEFNALAAGEAALLADARWVTGRTGYDRTAMAELAPRARYFACNETLRPVFYGAEHVWQPHDYGPAPILFVSQGNYPLKNLHTLLAALPAVLKKWPGAVLVAAGWPPLDKGPLLRPVIEWMFPYQRCCRRLITKLALEDHVRYTGPLDAAAMRDSYLGADVFILPSYCENSPNSLGEAMLLGVPCVASAVGGVPDLATDTEVQLYSPAGSAAALGTALCTVLENRTAAAAMGAAARRRALHTHDAAANAAAMLAIYRAILAETAGGAAHG